MASRDIVAQIVTNALAPDRIGPDGLPTPESPLEERLRILQNALNCTRDRVLSQEAQLAALKRDLQSYRGLVETMKTRTDEAEVVVAPLPLPPAPAPIEFETPTKVPVPNVGVPTVQELPVLVEVPEARRPMWLRAMPYAALAAFGLAVSSSGTLLRRAPEAPVSLHVRPVPAPATALSAAAAADKQELSEDQANAEVLSLIYQFVPQGGRASVEKILAPELEASSGGSPWVITRVGDHTALVTFRPYGETLETAPVYEFVVDTAAKTVTASAETLVNLRGGVLSAAR